MNISSQDKDADDHSPVEKLKDHLKAVVDLNHAGAVLSWDQEVNLPTGGAQARASQLSTLGRISHEILVSKTTEELLRKAEDSATSVDRSQPDSLFLRKVRREFDQATKIPSSFVELYNQTISTAFHTWNMAREKSDFSVFRDSLKDIIDLNLEKANYLDPEKDPYDVHLDLYEPDMTTTKLNEIFSPLKGPLSQLADELSRLAPPDPDPLQGEFDEQSQWELTRMVLTDMGYDFNRGRQDKSIHPFTTSFGRDDVRITTRFFQNNLISGLYSSIHEGGHALYEQGIQESMDRTFLGEGTSLGIHESQSRLWENMIGRSKEFLSGYLQPLRELFPEQFSDTDTDSLFRSVNRVQKGPIRVEADEVTYNLHIFVRFEIEQELFSGHLQVEDLRDAWNERYQSYLGLYPESDAQGILQDVHWSHGAMGYFPTYTIGNIVAAMLFEKMQDDLPDMMKNIQFRKFEQPLHWLRENIHVHGAGFTPEELLQSTFGHGLDSGPFLRYLQNKYGDMKSG